MDRGAWRATVHGVAKSQAQLSTHTATALWSIYRHCHGPAFSPDTGPFHKTSHIPSRDGSFQKPAASVDPTPGYRDPTPSSSLSAQSKNSEHWDNERSKGCSGSTEGLIFSLSQSPEPGCFMAAPCWVPGPCPALRQDLSHVSLTVWSSLGLRGVPSIHLQCRGHRFNSWSRQIRRAAGQPSPCTTSTKRCALGPVLRNKRSHSEKPVGHNYRAAPTLRN